MYWRAIFTSIVAMSLLGAVCAGTAGAAPGEIDTSFGVSGIAKVSLLEIANGPGSTIVGVGIVPGDNGTFEPALYRLTSDGVLDPAFGDGGSVGLGFGRGTFAGVDDSGAFIFADATVAAKPDNSCGGWTYYVLSITRFTSAGVVDNAFGDGGVVTVSHGGVSDIEDGVCQGIWGEKIAILPNQGAGQPLLAAYVADVTFGSNAKTPILTRLLPDGSLDPAFGDAGSVAIDALTGFGEKVEHVAADAAGENYYVVTSNENTPYIGVAKINSDGNLVATYGDAGVARGTIANQPWTTFSLLESGEMLVANARPYWPAQGYGAVPVRLGKYDANGSPVAAFPTQNDTLKFAGTKADSWIHSVLELADGSVVLAGTSHDWVEYEPPGSGSAVGRQAFTVMTPSGMPDTRFGIDGRVLIPATGGGPAIVQANGRIVQVMHPRDEVVGLVRFCGLTPCDGVAPSKVAWGTLGFDQMYGSFTDDVIKALAGNDLVTVGDGRNVVYAGPGNDKVTAGKHSDKLFGSDGADILNGMRGADSLNGEGGIDTLYGGDGDDILRLGLAADIAKGGTGNDTVYARDGVRDRVYCDSGRDVVYADRLDSVASSCERVYRA